MRLAPYGARTAGRTRTAANRTARTYGKAYAYGYGWLGGTYGCAGPKGRDVT
ncbi:hypothetical protein HFP70_35685 [Streptomyces sp. ARC14]|uniref:hypothetical protein n=1 Tax=Streptomyces sp. ARC14 TaxID=2724152 RepID=UPI0038579FD6